MSQLKHTGSIPFGLANPSPEIKGDQLRMERRRFPRRLVEATVTAVYNDHAGRLGVTPLELTDTSITGMGAKTKTRLEAGTKIMICPTAVPVPSRACTVVHCEAIEGDEFEVGLRFDMPKRAA